MHFKITTRYSETFFKINLECMGREEKFSKKRAVAPIIAHLVIIAIAVVGGTISFVFAQNIINTEQVSGYPKVELVKIDGFDAREVSELLAHDGNYMETLRSAGFINDFLKTRGERIAIYVTNYSVEKIVISELSLAGIKYDYVNPPTLDIFNGPAIPEKSYAILTKPAPDTLLQVSSPIIEAGQPVTLILDLEENYKMGRYLQIKFTTNNGMVTVGTIIAGEQKAI